MPQKINLEVKYSPQEIEQMLIETTRAHLGPVLVNSTELAGLRGEFRLAPGSKIYSDMTVVFEAREEDEDE